MTNAYRLNVTHFHRKSTYVAYMNHFLIAVLIFEFAFESQSQFERYVHVEGISRFYLAFVISISDRHVSICVSLYRHFKSS